MKNVARAVKHNIARGENAMLLLKHSMKNVARAVIYDAMNSLPEMNKNINSGNLQVWKAF